MKKMEIKPRKAPAPPGSARKRWTIVGLVVLVVGSLGAAAYWRYTHPPEDPQVAKVKELQQQMFASFNPERPTASPSASTTPVSATPAKPAMTPQERSAAMQQLRAEMDKLTEEQQEQVRREAGNAFRERMHATMKEYRALPKEKRAAFLDKQIDDMERRNGQFQRERQRTANRGAGGQGGAGGGTQPTSTGGAAANGNNGGGNGQRGNGPPRTPERRLEWRRQMLANSTPQERAEADLYFTDLNARRKARGMEPFGPGRPR